MKRIPTWKRGTSEKMTGLEQISTTRGVASGAKILEEIDISTLEVEKIDETGVLPPCNRR